MPWCSSPCCWRCWRGRAGRHLPRRKIAGRCGWSELAVTPMGNVPIVTVRVNGAPAEFLFDTGAERTILTAAAAQTARGRRALRICAANAQPRRCGGRRRRAAAQPRLRRHGTRRISGYWSARCRCRRSPASRSTGCSGADFFTGFEVDLDLAHRRIILYEPPPCPIAAPAWSAPYATIEANRSLHDRLFFPVRLDGHKLAALIDTGAQLTTLDADSAAALGVTGAALARDPVTTLRGAAAEVVKSRAHRFAELQIDGETLARPDHHGRQARLAGCRSRARRRFPALAAGLALLSRRTGFFWSGIS